MTKRLLTLPVLLVDCQTTANSPEKGHLLEVGWLPYRAADTSLPEEWAVHADLVRLPGDATLPTRVRRLTGIHPAGLNEAAPERVVWRRLSAAADEVARQSGFQRCPVVIHFARFERPFLQRLHQKCDFGTGFPFELICTHDISRRLYPELPRRGIRALSGFLGHSVPSARRCDGHVRATAVIWRHLVNRLAVEEQVASLDDLRRWLAERPVPEPLPRRYPMPRHQRKKAPDAPGIYRFIRSNGDLLYIGKARSLKKRLNSYFQPRRRHPEHVLEMLTQAAHIEVTVTASALEAALMESEAIKECSPPYNVALIEGDRAPIFVSRDFGRRSKSVDDVCCVGPLVSNDLVRLVHSVGCALGSGGSSAGITDGKAKAILAARLCPDETMLVRGHRLLSREACCFDCPSRPLASLAEGRARWLEGAVVGRSGSASAGRRGGPGSGPGERGPGSGPGERRRCAIDGVDSRNGLPSHRGDVDACRSPDTAGMLAYPSYRCGGRLAHRWQWPWDACADPRRRLCGRIPVACQDRSPSRAFRAWPEVARETGCPGSAGL